MWNTQWSEDSRGASSNGGARRPGFANSACGLGLIAELMRFYPRSYSGLRIFTAENGFLYMQWKLLFVGTIRSTYLTDSYDLYFLFSLLLFLGVFCFKIYTTMCIQLTERILNLS